MLISTTGSVSGTSSLSAVDRSTSRKSFVLLMISSMPDLFRLSGKTAAWIVKPVLLNPPNLLRGRISPRQRSSLTPSLIADSLNQTETNERPRRVKRGVAFSFTGKEPNWGGVRKEEGWDWPGQSSCCQAEVL